MSDPITTADAPIMQESAPPAPRRTSRQANTDTNANPFGPVFGRLVFSNLKKIEPMKPFNDGTIQTRLTEVAIELGHNTGAYLQGAFIVKREKGDAIKIRLQLPTGATRFQKLISLEEANTNVVDAWDAFENSVVDKWKTYRKKEKAAGNVQTIASDGHVIAKNELSELGF